VTARRAIDALLARYGRQATSTRLVARLDCEIHRITCGGGDLALRIYAEERADRAAIDTEIGWLEALADAGLHVPGPLADRSGRTLQVWQPDPARPARHAVLLSWVGGRQLDRALRPLHLKRVGELTARMHRVAERLVAEGRIGTARRADMPDLAGWADGRRPHAGRVSPALRSRLRETARRLQNDIAALPGDSGSFGLVHGDLHLWNLLFAGGAAGAIDFSDCGFGPHALDLAATLQYLRFPFVHNHDHRAVFPALQQALFEGYAAHRALPVRVEHQVEVCTVARMLNTVEWVVDVWQRPDLRAWGPGLLRRAGTIFDGYLR